MTASGNFSLQLGSAISGTFYYDNYIHTFILDSKNLKIEVDDIFYNDLSINESEYSISIYTGAVNRLTSSGSQSIIAYSTEKIYSSKIYENDELIQHLIPCTNENGVVGMYDVIGQKFYSSLTSDSFIYGN